MARRRDLQVALLAGVLVLLVGYALNLLAGSLLDAPDGPAYDARTPAAGRSPTAHPEPATEPLLVTQVGYIPRQNAHTWLHRSPLSAETVDQLNRELHGAGGIRSGEGDSLMRRSGAVESTISTVELEIEGNRDSPVRITGVRAVPRCRAPLDGTLFYSPVQGAFDVVQLGFDLDDSNPIGQYVKPDPLDGPPRFTGDYFANHTYTLKRYEQVTFRFSARSLTQYCEYRYRFDLIVNGTRHHQLVDDGGEPFRVSAEIQDGGGLATCDAYGSHYIGNTFAQGDPAQLKETPWIEPREAQPFVCG